MTQPTFEKIDPNLGNSFFTGKYDFPRIHKDSFWHVHPEYELVFIPEGRGKRHIGNHVSFYENGDLLFIGPNIPHTLFKNTEVLVQLPNQFVEGEIFQLPEFTSIKELLDRTKRVISFHTKIKDELAERFKKLIELRPYERLMELIQILNELSKTKEFKTLDVDQVIIDIHSNDYERINKIYAYVSSNYKQNIKLEEVAELINLTTNSFCRFFKKVTDKTFIQFLNEYRINKVCGLLGSRNTSISDIVYECGFNDIAYFTRQFKKKTGVSPGIYRNQLKNWVNK